MPRNRFVFSGSWALPKWRNAPRAAAFVANGWQLNTITSLSTGTPFTVYDSADVSLQGSAPEITGFYSSRPDLISIQIKGQPHTANEWVSRAPFLQLNPVTQAGQFGNEGRNVVRGPGIEDVDLSLFKYFNIERDDARTVSRGVLQPAQNHRKFSVCPRTTSNRRRSVRSCRRVRRACCNWRSSSSSRNAAAFCNRRVDGLPVSPPRGGSGL